MKTLALTFASVFALSIACQAALKPGDSLSPYTIHNVSSGKEYCQVCAYGAKPAKLIAFGKFDDESYWADLKKLQAIQDAHPKLGVFAHVFDSADSDAVKAAAARHGITFPVVVTAEKDWNDKYDVNGVSRTIYYAQQKNNITWTSTGLDAESVKALETQVNKDASN